MRLRFLLLVSLLAAGLGGCGKGAHSLGSSDPFVGKWTFDRDYTQSHLPKEAVKSPESPAPAQSSPGDSHSEAAEMSNDVNGMLNNTLKPMLTDQLITQMDGQTFAITPKLITDSSGQTRTYEVVERATPNDLSIKVSDGEIWTLIMEDGRIIMPTTGSVHFKMYFKRVAP